MFLMLETWFCHRLYVLQMLEEIIVVVVMVMKRQRRRCAKTTTTKCVLFAGKSLQVEIWFSLFQSVTMSFMPLVYTLGCLVTKRLVLAVVFACVICCWQMKKQHRLMNLKYLKNKVYLGRLRIHYRSSSLLSLSFNNYKPSIKFDDPYYATCLVFFLCVSTQFFHKTSEDT